ncbi:uncharacterized protein [Heliangelus exortis]|uniref:uncharacterized protein isoform X1 n=1 Tax=Heliangelus exortis TaxID=472823 RepID=UPI003A955511
MVLPRPVLLLLMRWVKDNLAAPIFLTQEEVAALGRRSWWEDGVERIVPDLRAPGADGSVGIKMEEAAPCHDALCTGSTQSLQSTQHLSWPLLLPAHQPWPRLVGQPGYPSLGWWCQEAEGRRESGFTSAKSSFKPEHCFVFRAFLESCRNKAECKMEGVSPEMMCLVTKHSYTRAVLGTAEGDDERFAPRSSPAQCHGHHQLVLSSSSPPTGGHQGVCRVFELSHRDLEQLDSHTQTRYPVGGCLAMDSSPAAQEATGGSSCAGQGQRHRVGPGGLGQLGRAERSQSCFPCLIRAAGGAASWPLG